MVWRYKIIGIILLLFCIWLSGCLREELDVTINADGSGKYTVIKFLGNMEETMIAAVDGAKMGDMSAEEVAEEIKSRSEGPVECVGYEIVKNYRGRGKAEITKYSFDDLGEAVVVLENMIQMGPRFKYDDGRFYVFVDREKTEYDGMSADGIEDEFYYKLTVNLSEKPVCDSRGEVEGNSVSWEFGNEAMNVYRESEIGTRLLWASVDAGAVKTELTPKLYVKKEESRRKREVSYLKDFFCNIELLEESKPFNASFTGYVPTGDIALPFSYEHLEVVKLVVDGEEKECRLESSEAGIFAGKSRWGRDVPGLPVKVSFTETDPWVKNIDLLEVELETSKPVKTVTHSVKIDDMSRLPRVVKFGGSCVAILEAEQGANSAAYPLPNVEVVTDLNPADIIGCYLDTKFGFRYKSAEPRWKTVRSYKDEKYREQFEQFRDAGQLRKGTLNFENVPNDEFTLVFEVITEKRASTETLKLEDVYVGSK